MKRLGLILLILICLPVGFLIFQKLQTRRPSVVSGCPDWAIAQFHSATDIIHPEKVVIKPWQGRHNVFATFKIPDGYQPSSVFVVLLDDSNLYCGRIQSKSPSGEISKNHVFGPFRTRTTLLLMSRGQIDQLERPINWKLAIFKQL